MGSLWGQLDDVTGDAGYVDHEPRMGFFTDTSVCIGCKACEVACKEWNQVPDDGFELTGMSYDNTQALGASTWRHVAFVEKPFETVAAQPPQEPPHPTTTDLGLPGMGPPGWDTHESGLPSGEDQATASGDGGIRWLMSSDVCKHCTHAACLDVCPTGSLFRTEFGTVVVQPDICNGCGYCVPACPYGVIDLREDDGRAFKCTLCYDRLKDGQTPACAQACPTESIQFGEVGELRERARLRVAELHDKGVDVARRRREMPLVDHAEGARRHAVAAAVADVLLHDDRAELRAEQSSGRADVEARSVRAVLADVRLHQPAQPRPAVSVHVQGLVLLDEGDVAP